MDVSDLQRIGGTGAGGYYRLAPDVILAYPRDGYVQSEAGARASLLEQHRIARASGRRQVLVVLVDRVRSQDSGARRVWQAEADPHLMIGLALVGATPLARAIGSFFLGLRRPKIRTGMFADLSSALAWSTELTATRGGEIDA